MADAIERTQTDTTVRVVFFTGSDDIFTAGNNFNKFDGGGTKEEQTPGMFLAFNLAQVDVLVVGVVNRMAVGIGVIMLLHFDQCLPIQKIFLRCLLLT